MATFRSMSSHCAFSRLTSRTSSSSLAPSAAVRTRALQALAGAKPDILEQWLPSIQRMIADQSLDVRAAATSALVNIRQEHVTDLLRPFLQDREPSFSRT